MRRMAVSTDQLQQAWQNRQRDTEPVPVGTLIRALIKAERLDTPNPLINLRKAWAESIGPELSCHSRPESLRRGTLSVMVDSAAHLTELQSLARSGLVEGVAARFCQRPIKRIRLRLGYPNASDRQTKRTD